jgi:hypothetical protein
VRATSSAAPARSARATGSAGRAPATDTAGSGRPVGTATTVRPADTVGTATTVRPADTVGTATTVRPADTGGTPDTDSSSAGPAGDDVLATRDIARLLRYGEQFGDERIDVRMLPLQLHLRSGTIGVFDPASPATWHEFERPSGSGAFRVMLSVARPNDGDGGRGASERLAAVVIHTGRPPIARWTAAPFKDSAADALPRTVTRSGWLALLDASDGAPGVLALPEPAGVAPIEVPLTDGRRALAVPCGVGQFAAYWALDAADRPVCIVIDFDAFTQKAWKARRAT